MKTINWTYLGTDVYHCSDIVDFSNILANIHSIVCVLLYVFMSVLAVLTVCGNFLVIISIIYFKQLHTPTNYLILSLAVADLLVGIVVFPISMAFNVKTCLYFKSLLCKVRGSFDISLSTCSILHLVCISVDRYYAVSHPLTYRTKINHNVVVIMILVCWGVSVLSGIILAELNNVNCGDMCLMEILVANTVGGLLSFYLPVIIMLCIYLKIFLVAQKQVRSIHNTTKCGAAVSKMERKATKTLAIVLGVFLLCWSPFFLCITFLPLAGDSMSLSLTESIRWLALSNSMFNPFIYAFFYSWFRSAFRIIFSRKVFQGDFTNCKLH